MHEHSCIRNFPKGIGSKSRGREALSILAAVACGAVVALCNPSVAEAAPNFAPGQIWSIKSAIPTTAKVIIVNVELWKKQAIVQISVVDIPVPKGLSRKNCVARVGHMPFEEHALATSVDHLLGTNGSPAPGFEYGYNQWRNDGDAAVFTEGVLQAIQEMQVAAGCVSERKDQNRHK